MKSRIVYTPSGASKKRQKARRVFWYTLIVVAVLLLSIGAVTALRATSLQIRQITLRGVSTLDTHAIRESINAHLAGTRIPIVPRSSFFLVNADAIASDLERRFPRIEQAAAVKTFPDKLDVTITERTLWGVFCTGLESSSTPMCGYIDAGGVVYEQAPEPRGSLLTVIRSDVRSDGEGDAVPRQAIDMGVMAEIRALRDKLPTSAGVQVINFELRSRVSSEIRATTGAGFTLIFRRENDVSGTLRVLKRVLDEEIKNRQSKLDYIDLRFGNKVFYKMK